jgi:hypothetical protein
LSTPPAPARMAGSWKTKSPPYSKRPNFPPCRRCGTPVRT